VRMSMWGHTHTDIFYTANSFNRFEYSPISVMTVCGSLTTWGGLNPSYCVYELDKETLLPVTRHTWSFDIPTANHNGQPSWSLFTNWLEDYNMKDLSPSSYFDFA
jgi:sphingomyelin phosphodiesterase